MFCIILADVYEGRESYSAMFLTMYSYTRWFTVVNYPRAQSLVLFSRFGKTKTEKHLKKLHNNTNHQQESSLFCIIRPN